MPRKIESRRLALWWDVLVLTVRGKRDAYRLVEVDGDGPRCWELRRHDPPPGEPELYLVWLPTAGPRCTCPAGKRGKRCKHIDSVLRLIDLGRL